MLLVTAIAAVFAFQQLQAARNTALGELLLHIDERFEQHKRVHSLLRPGGDWSNGKGSPVSNEDWLELEAYMGLFERIYVLVEKKMIDIDVVNRFYGYRVKNIVSNPTICNAKLVEERHSWQDFCKLCEKLNIEINSNNNAHQPIN